MRLTVITVSLNAAATITATLDSVLAHGGAIHEYLVIDGLSTDGTVDILRRYEPLFGGRLRWVTEKDSGLYDAMNKGIALATGDFVLFLGADDLLLPGIDAMISADVPDDTDLLFGDVDVVEPDGGLRLERGGVTPRLLHGVPKDMPGCHQGALFSLKAYRDLGGFDTSFRIAADYEFYLRFYEAGLSAIYLPIKIARFDLGGVSARMGVATASEYRRAQVAHGVSPTLARLSMVRARFNLKVAGWIRRIPMLRGILKRRR